MDRDLDRFEVEKELEIKTLPLSLSIPQDIKTIDILKIDVQGCELDVLIGSKNKITEDKPLIIVEIEDSQVSKFNNTANDIIEYLQNELHYDLYQMMTDWPSDFLCVPKNSKINTQFETFYLKPILTEKDRIRI